MKKTLCVIFVCLLVCTLFVPALAKEGITHGDTVLSINGVVSAVLKPGYASLDTSFTNNTSKDVSVTMVMTEFAENNGYKKQINRSLEQKVIPAGKTIRVLPGLEISANGTLMQYFAYETESLEPIEVERYALKNAKYMGTENDETRYNIYTFDDMNNPKIDNSEVETLSAPSICTWQGGRKAAVSITMDDGNYSAALAYLELFKKYGIHGTEFMIPGYFCNTDGSVRDANRVKEWQEIFDTGYIDAGNHSYHHQVKYDDSTTADILEHDITDSYNALKKCFPTQSLIAYATPWGRNPQNAINEIKKNHYANRAAGGDIVTSKTPTNIYEIPTAVILYGTTASQLNNRLDRAISSGGWSTELYHGIGKEGSSPSDGTTNIAVMEEHLQYIASKAEEVWAGSLTEVVKYIYERDSAKAEQLWATDSGIGIKLTDGVDDGVFDYPLTVKVNLPLSWSGSVKCTQYGKTETAEIFTENGKNYAYVNIVPDSGYAVIKR